jgi:hypothetical protein
MSKEKHLVTITMHLPCLCNYLEYYRTHGEHVSKEVTRVHFSLQPFGGTYFHSAKLTLAEHTRRYAFRFT